MTEATTSLEAARAAALHDLDYTLGAVDAELDALVALAARACGAAVDAELDALVALAARACGASAAAISLLDGEDFVRIAISDGLTRDGPGKGEKVRVVARTAFAMRAMMTGQTLVVPDAQADPDWANYAQVLNPPFIRSYAGAPIGPAADLPLGVLSIVHSRPNAFGPREIALLESVAEPVRLHFRTRLETIRAGRAAAKTEDERRRQLQFEQIFQAIPVGANVYAADGRMIETNPAAPRILGLTREQLMERTPADPSWQIYQEDGAPFLQSDYPISQALRGITSRNVVMGVELPDGERRWLTVNATPVLKEHGEVDFAVVSFKDVTLERAAAQQLKAEGVRLVEALTATVRASQAKTDFLSVMSHELRTPMNAIIGCAALLRQSKLESPQVRTLGVLEDASRQMLALLNDLFDLSTLENGKVRLTYEPTNLVRLIEDAAVIWAANVRAKGLSLSVMIDPALVAPRSVDPGRVLQIIGNLMANAIKFTPRAR